MGEIIYEAAKLNDVDEIVQLAKEFEKEHFAIVTEKNPKIRGFLKRKKEWPELFKRYVIKCIRSPRSAIFVARCNDAIIGYTIVTINKNIPVFKLEEYGYFGDLYVKKEHRGKGISSKLKNMAIAWLKRKGIKAAYISAHWGNALARKIYEKWEFVPRHIQLCKWL